MPIELTREEVRVQKIDVPDRPLRPGEHDAFKEGTIRVPVRGEEAFVEKQAVVTGEVVIHKERVTERQNVQDTVRKERVEVDRDFEKARPTFMEHFNRNRTRALGSTTCSFEEAEPNYRWGWEAARDPRFQGRRFEEIKLDLRCERTTRYATTSRPTSGRQPWEELRKGLTGAITGGTLGGILAIGALAVPGVGPLFVGGTIAAALTGAALGAIGGGLIGALGDAGVPEAEARRYQTRVTEGYLLLSVQATDAEQAAAVREILERNEATEARQYGETAEEIDGTVLRDRATAPENTGYWANAVKEDRAENERRLGETG